MDLNGRTAVVTGSTSGIGRAIAAALADAGARVVINGIEPLEEGEGVADELARSHQTETRYSNADMS